MVLLMVVWASAGIAETALPTPQSECTSCTARHKALQKLQDARVTPPPSDALKPEADVEKVDD
jgi:hypothetical protein